MFSSSVFAPGLFVAAAACSALLAVGAPSAVAAPASDGRGYVDSTARCTSPQTAVAFGRTATSRIAICKTAGGQYEYRGVRVRDGAKLVVPASQSGNGEFVAEVDGIVYTVSASSLVVSAGKQVIRDEPMVEFHGPSACPLTHSTPPRTATPTPVQPPLAAEVGGSGG